MIKERETLVCPACNARTLANPYTSAGKWYSRCAACRSVAILESVLLDHPDRTVPPTWQPFKVVGIAIDSTH